MTKTLTAPCRKCPFRAEFQGDSDYLRAGRRRGIVENAEQGGTFPCHNTVDYDAQDDDEWEAEHVHTDGEVPCVGLDLALLRAERPPQMLRIRMSLGHVDPDKLLADNADVKLWSYNDLITDGIDDDFEPCSVVGPDCEAPAGYMVGGAVVHGEESADRVCDGCGMPVCAACSTTSRDGEFPDGLVTCDDCVEQYS